MNPGGSIRARTCRRLIITGFVLLGAVAVAAEPTPGTALPLSITPGYENLASAVIIDDANGRHVEGQIDLLVAKDFDTGTLREHASSVLLLLDEPSRALPVRHLVIRLSRT